MTAFVDVMWGFVSYAPCVRGKSFIILLNVQLSGQKEEI